MIPKLNKVIDHARAIDPSCRDWNRVPRPDEVKGASISRRAFFPLVAGPVRGIEMLIDGRKPDLSRPIDDKDIAAAAESWEQASEAFGLSTRGAAVVSAAGHTLATVGKAVAKGLIRLFWKDDEQDI